MMENRESLVFFAGFRGVEIRLWLEYFGNASKFQTALRQALAGGKSGRQGPFVQSKDTTRKQLIKTGSFLFQGLMGFQQYSYYKYNIKKLFMCIHPNIDLFIFISISASNSSILLK